MDSLITDLQAVGVTVDAKTAPEVVRVILSWLSRTAIPVSQLETKTVSSKALVSTEAQSPTRDDLTPKPVKIDTSKHVFRLVEPFNYSVPDIDRRRAYIAKLSGLSDYPDLTEATIRQMYLAYDKYFFGGMIEDMLTQTKRSLVVELSKNMTSSAGSISCRMSPNGETQYVLRIGAKVFADVTPEGVALGRLTSGGLKVTSRLQAFQLTLEHEMLHLLIRVEGSRAGDTSHGPMFQAMARNLFGQTVCTHGLITASRAAGGEKQSLFVPPASEVQMKDRTAISGQSPDQIRAHLAAQLEKRTQPRVSFTLKKVHVYGKVVSTNGPVNAKVLLDDGRTYCVRYPALTLH